MFRQQSLTSLVTGASATMIALTSFSAFFLTASPLLSRAGSVPQVWLMILASSCATLLVMSLLHNDLQKLYGLLAEREEQARKDARLDPLTGLGNRKFLIEELEDRLEGDPVITPMALLFVDLDHFKRVNDTMGHRAGDQLIMAVAARIRETLSGAATARLGGDEFAAIVELAEGQELSPICETLTRRLSAPFRVGENEAFIGGSVGAAFLEQGLDAGDVMRRADVAMYRAKTTSSGYQVFDDPMIADVERRAELANALRKCLRGDEGLSAMYQAIVSPDGEMQALEALLRWQHETLGPVAPLEIISIAEETHLLNEVGLFMAQQAYRAAVSLPGIGICLNMRAVQLLDARYGESLIRIAVENDIPAGQLCLEIREHDFVERGNEIAPVLARLRDAGFRVAVDDFGSSTSSLAHLKALGVTTLKLDPSVLKNAQEVGSIAIMRAKVSLAKALGMTVVCEGVHSPLDEAAAVQAGCDLLQGFRYSQPAVLSNFLAQREKVVLAQRAVMWG